MSYLTLCQDTARESGTISGTAPTTVTGQSVRLLKVVNWVATAWKEIQNLHDDWLWMRTEFSGPIVQGTARYLYTAMTGITRWSRWITDCDSMTIYKTATGVSDEGPLREITWDQWRARYGRGTQTQNRPTEYAISPQGEICLGPVPDAAYTLRGEYQKSAQVLTADADIPELPDTSLHSVIVWKALLLLAQFDEGAWETGAAQVRCQDDLRSMQKYRPKLTVGFGSGTSIA